MKIAEYLDAAKVSLNVDADNALAKAIDVPRQDVSRWRKGENTPDAYACTKIAITLNLDPSIVIADVLSQAEKNPKRADFWRSFLSHARKATGAALCMLALIGSVGSGSALETRGGGARGRRLAF